MTSEEFRLEETLATYQWMVDNWELWELICGFHREPLTPEQMAGAIQSIMDAKLYPLLFVFLTNYQHILPLGDIAQKAYHGRIIAAWQEDTITELAADIMNRLRTAEVKEEVL